MTTLWILWIVKSEFAVFEIDVIIKQYNDIKYNDFIDVNPVMTSTSDNTIGCPMADNKHLFDTKSSDITIYSVELK